MRYRGACGVMLPRSLLPPEATLRMRLSVPPLGMLLTVPASGSRGLSLPDLALLEVWGQKGTGRALTGCRQELPQLKLERPEKGGRQPRDWSYRRGREERRRKQHLNWPVLLAAPRVRAVRQH
ncbi:uncharacterized protein LJ206_016264 isoform 1-T1 [Theristicus caerulescens]